MHHVKDRYTWALADIIRTSEDGDIPVKTTGYARMHLGVMHMTCFVVFDEANAWWTYSIFASENPMSMPTVAIVHGARQDTEKAAMAACDVFASRISNHLVLNYILQ